MSEQTEKEIKVSTKWHQTVPKDAKAKGILISNSAEKKFVIQGYDNEFNEWFGRATDEKGSPIGNELGFGTHEAFGLVKTDLKKAIRVNNIFFLKTALGRIRKPSGYPEHFI